MVAPVMVTFASLPWGSFSAMVIVAAALFTFATRPWSVERKAWGLAAAGWDGGAGWVRALYE